MSDDWTPSFPGQRPPFPSGNDLATRHGAHSDRKLQPLAQQLVDQVLADPATGYLRAGQWQPALWAWARAEAQAHLLTEYLAKAGEVTDDGVGDLDSDRVRSAYLLLHRVESRATTLRARLGLDPLSRARLGRDTTAAVLDAARLMSETKTDQQGGTDG